MQPAANRNISGESDTRPCLAIQLGQIDYRQGWDIQRRLAAARAAGQIADTLLLVEHPPTYTLGRSTQPGHLLLDPELCAARGITVVEVDRGGDITYHGPGQLVAYPICYLGKVDVSGRLPQTDYIGYLRSLEEVLIRTVAVSGITARRETGYTGVWVDTPGGPQKIAAIGIRINTQGISTHGVALNVTTDLDYFGGIIPCGITDRAVTSMQMLLGDAAPSMPRVIGHFTAAFAAVFGYDMAPAALSDLLPEETDRPAG